MRRSPSSSWRAGRLAPSFHFPVAIVLVLCLFFGGVDARNASARSQEATVGVSRDAARGVGDCAGLRGAFDAVPGAPARVTVAEERPAETVRIGEAGHGAAPHANGKDVDLPAHCLLKGVIAPQIHFELRLPAEAAWNGDYFQVFCTGGCGVLLTESCFPALARGFAVATNDGGHEGAGLGFHLWGYGNRDAEIDFGYRANHVQAVVSKAIAEAYYGQPAEKSYGAGCSKGGQAAVMEAARYPDDFDGLIANAPVVEYSGRSAIGFSWLMQATHDAQGNALLDPQALELVHQAVLEECDELDGLSDGVLNDPAACRFDPAILTCRPGGAEACLTPEQVAAVRRTSRPPRDSSGRRLFSSGQAWGSEREGAVFLTRVPGVPGTPIGAELANGFLGSLAFPRDPGPSFTWRDFDFDRDPRRLRKQARLWDVQNDALSAYRRRGGKLLIYHGTADAGIPVGATTTFYKKLVRRNGGLRATQRFARLFLIPGAAHCNGGDGTDRLDPITALQRWVEDGAAPESIIAWRERNGDVDLRIPAFAYPLVPRYRGSGPQTDPASFKPVRSASW